MKSQEPCPVCNSWLSYQCACRPKPAVEPGIKYGMDSDGRMVSSERAEPRELYLYGRHVYMGHAQTTYEVTVSGHQPQILEVIERSAYEAACKERDEWQHEALQSRESLSDICKERDFCKVQWEMTSERLTKERDALAAQLAKADKQNSAWMRRDLDKRIAELETELAEANNCKHPGCCCVCGHTGKCPEDGPCAIGGTLE